MTIAPIFTALDTNDEAAAYTLAAQLNGLTHYKIGLEYFLKNGAAGVKSLSRLDGQIFLDLKLHDIPNTVAGALKSLLPLRVGFTTLHASGGAAMLKAAVTTAAIAGEQRPKLLAVTILTSLDETDMNALNQPGSVTDRVVRYALLAKECGCDGIVAAPTEIAPLRAALGDDFLIVTPGIRPHATEDDQKRTLTPREALNLGANYLVIGRPITAAPDPAVAAVKIVESL